METEVNHELGKRPTGMSALCLLTLDQSGDGGLILAVEVLSYILSWILKSWILAR